MSDPFPKSISALFVLILIYFCCVCTAMHMTGHVGYEVNLS